MNYPLIQSIRNPKVKLLEQLHKPRARRAHGLILVEGKKEITLALAAGIQLQSVFFDPRYTSAEWVHQQIANKSEAYVLSPEAFAKVAYREESGIIAIAQMPERKLEQLQLPSYPLLIVVEAVEKPGNLGAILRTADAAGVDAVIICDPQTDLYNPNVIRASLGCLFTVPTVAASSQEVVAWLRQQGIRIFTTGMHTQALPYTAADFTQSSALVFGTESVGLSSFWLAASDQNIVIPMRGHIDSLNVSNACAIITFEAWRQRGFSGWLVQRHRS